MASSPSRSRRSTDLSADLLVRGGTIVTADESFAGDVVVRDGRIEAVIRADGTTAATRAAVSPVSPVAASPAAAREIDASGLLVLPGIVDVHTHTRVPSDELPDRFFEDSVGAAFGGTTTFLTFNNPGTGISEAAQRTLRAGIAEFHTATAGESAVDFGLSGVITAQQERPEDDIAAAIEGGVATFKVFFVYDFGVDAQRLRQLLQVTDAAGGMLEVHGEDRETLDAGIAAQIAAGRTQPRYHADSRPPAVEAKGIRVAIEAARDTATPVYFVHVTSAAAVDEIATARRRGQPVFAETCPQYLALDESCYEVPDEQCTRYVISPPLRPKSDQDALWKALQQGQLDLIATDSVPDTLADEKRWIGQSFDQISNGSPGIETLLTMVYGKGVATGRLSIEKAVDLLATTPARMFGLQSKGAIAPGKDADLVLFDPEARRTIRATDHHHSADFTLFEGMEVQGAVRRTIVRGEDVVRDGEFVGRRGFGCYQRRSLA